MYSYHVLLLPVAVVALVVAHVLLVRRHGVVPPFVLEDRGASRAAGTPAAGVPPVSDVQTPGSGSDGATS
jgi:quinol-cytochrome oxidoreductase complex cytochrome b subunit